MASKALAAWRAAPPQDRLGIDHALLQIHWSPVEEPYDIEVRRIFADALELARDERAGFIERECGGVEIGALRVEPVVEQRTYQLIPVIVARSCSAMEVGRRQSGAVAAVCEESTQPGATPLNAERNHR